MAVLRSHFRVALTSAELETQQGREFFQERLGIFAFWNCLISFTFLPLRLGLEAAFDPAFAWSGVLGRPGLAAHATSCATMAIVWGITRPMGVLSSGTLSLLDAIATIVACFGYALMGAGIARGDPMLIDHPSGAMQTATLAIVFTTMWRAVTVPATPSRTALITTLAILPLAVADVLVLGRSQASWPARAAAVPFALLWAAAALALSIVASNVVLGLRREVQRARQLGQYTLDEKIGEGAMGVVYRARHALLRRPTAIKLLPPERTGQKNLQRFEREVQLTASLTHPNTVAIYDYGRTPDGIFYYAMEYLDGIDLEDLIRRFGAQPAGRVIHILRQVCRALSEAHGLGVIHRDIKPGNIILTVRGGEPDVAKVVDFGLVKEIDATNATQTMSVDGNVLVGTPLYFSPEAISMPDEVEPRSDLYALGAVGYLLLTGKPLFEGRTIVELCAHHLHTRPIPPSQRVEDDIDPDLEAILLRCLEKSAEDRPASALALHDALATCAAAAEWSSADAHQWWESYRANVAEPLPMDRGTETETVAVDLEAR